MMQRKSAYAQLYLRLALGIDFLIPGLDRFGVWGANGSSRNVSWGDWKHFLEYARQTLSFLTNSIADMLAIIATAAELTFGLFLIIGLFTRVAASGSGILTLCFAVSMFKSFGAASPVNYSVFAVSAASFFLASIPVYKWSIDAWRLKNSLKK